ncbi:hypothetical protein [Lysinibacillus sp. G4S2]|uniref:hypothetical protein n=1 Tax=Lysinibacillus sp. G4S2 TaxID=3055859 RepID=UPI00338EE757
MEMFTLEEYISKRKREDKINEYDIDSKNENIRVCVNYVFEYFNQYLNIEEMEQKTFLNEERLVKFKNQLEKYEDAIQEWLVDIYDVHEKQIHRSIISFLKKEELFLLYNTEHEFRTCSYDCYAHLIKKNPFLKGQTEMLFNFIKDYHRIESEKELNNPSIFLTGDINEWLERTWSKNKVNVWAFTSNYLLRFSDDDSLWPVKHKIKTSENWQPYIYDYKQKTNLFNLNTLYTKISKKPFIKGKKQFLEVIFMYIWLHDIYGDNDNYWGEYCIKVINNLQN